jgi:plastocyanin
VKSGKSSITVLGFDDNRSAVGIPSEDQIHTAIFGEVGSGKSTVDTIMINQRIANTAVDSDKVSIAKGSWQSNSTPWYLPQVIRVSAGTVTWTNDDTIIHTVTDVANTFDLGIMQPNGSWIYTFNTKDSISTFAPFIRG